MVSLLVSERICYYSQRVSGLPSFCVLPVLAVSHLETQLPASNYLHFANQTQTMSRQVVIALCLLACLVAANAQFCRTSAYKLPVDKVKASKMAMFGNCGASVTVVSTKDVDGCGVIVQKVASKEAWDKYSACEKSSKNAALYGPLSKASSACSGKQASGAC